VRCALYNERAIEKGKTDLRVWFGKESAVFNGSVNFVAGVRGNGITFPRLNFNPNVASVDHVTIEAPDPSGRLCRSSASSILRQGSLVVTLSR
jgi:hypothetical protein